MQSSPLIDPNRPRVPPHAPLPHYYEEAKRQRYVIDLFNETARHYNTIEKLFGNVGLWYRRFALGRAGLAPGMRVLDVATGTGAVARGAARIVGPRGRVFGVDPSQGMLAEARRVFHGPITRGIGDRLPFASDTFDFVTMGLALRHVSDLFDAFGEYHRVLKPGGHLWILEAHVPRSKVAHAATRFVWDWLVPRMTLLFTRDRKAKELMDFYWDTIDRAAAPEQHVEVLRQVGFREPKYTVVVPGAFGEYTGVKAGSP
jgi:demethylmenaquinone methyltransferase / 2-methoxy-6-polyprenyl-1,4-benzoquinol methylase